MKKMTKISLIVDGSAAGELWGRILFDNNLIIESAPDLDSLQNKMKMLLKDFHDLAPEAIKFDVQYDVTVFFEEFNFLKITKIAELANLNKSLLLQYVSGKKNPSAAQLDKIQAAVRSLATKLAGATLFKGIPA